MQILLMRFGEFNGFRLHQLHFVDNESDFKAQVMGESAAVVNVSVLHQLERPLGNVDHVKLVFVFAQLSHFNHVLRVCGVVFQGLGSEVTSYLEVTVAQNYLGSYLVHHASQGSFVLFGQFRSVCSVFNKISCKRQKRRRRRLLLCLRL